MRKVYLGILVLALTISVLFGFKIESQSSVYAGKNDLGKQQCEKKIKHKIEFSFDENTFEKERAFANEYYKRVYGELTEEEKSSPDYNELYKLGIGIGTYDLNGDGNQEVFVYFQQYGLCTAHGCFLYVFKNVNGEYQEMFNGGVQVFNQVSIIKNLTNGIHDIAFGFCPNLSIWSWDKAKQSYIHKEGQTDYSAK